MSGYVRSISHPRRARSGSASSRGCSRDRLVLSAELPVLARSGSSNHLRATSAYPPIGDILWPMSVIVLISSALPPGADILDKVGNVSS